MTQLATIKKEALNKHLDNPTEYFSEREIARRAGVSHTLIQRILRDPTKTVVQAANARDIELVLGVAQGTFFDYQPTRAEEKT